MADTLPTFTQKIDNAFVETWYEIRAEAADNILLATVIWAALKTAGCFTSQRGGKLIERTVKYGVGPATKDVDKGDTLGMGEVETETAAFWTFRKSSVHIQRDLMTDRENAGKFRIKDYVAKRLKEARDSLTQQNELDVEGTPHTDESGKKIQNLNDLLPSYANRATGTYGKVARSNTWWQSLYKQFTDVNVTLVDDMRNLYNTVGANMEFPNLIITTQTLFELYEQYGLEQSQIVKDDSGSQMVDLGFEMLRFKGKRMIWSPNVTAGTMQFLNTNHIEVVYDPAMWFAMTEWKPIYNQMERLAHILIAWNIITDQPRRHGLLYT